jgi:hypothetical protein
MHKTMLAGLGAAMMMYAAPSTAQDIPIVPGNYWEVTEVDVQDGQFGAYADYLASQWRRTQEFAKSKGWIKDYHIFGTVNARAGEPDLYLVSVYERQPTAAEQMAREKEMNAFLQQDTRQQDTAYGGRVNMRKIGGSMLMQELRFRR